MRRLRPTQSELGEVDPAALFEFKKGRTIVYEGYRDTTCLVEADEEPPHDLNQEALEIALMVSLMVGATPIDETHVMRKVVIDGSTPFGFQRTAVVALNGEVEIGDKKVPIQTVGVEEDACRKTKEKGETTYFRLDRLGVPLIEVVTGPVIYSPEEAEEVALALGRILRATGRVRRGLGTIRQDLNISIKGGAISEIKGVQELELVSKAVAYEVQRQLTLLKIRDELRGRGVNEEDLKGEVVDVTEIFKATKCRVVKNAIDSGGRTMAVVLPRFSGLLGMELIPRLRFGTELSDYAKFWGRVGGIFHTDEMPAYGVSGEEVTTLREFLMVGGEDAVVFVADREENARDALEAVVGRAKTAIAGIPNETRSSYPDGTTHYSRPRPGAARMYPETDVPPVPITAERLKRIRDGLPEPPEVRLTRLMKDYELNETLAAKVLNSDYYGLFEVLAHKTRVATSFIAATLTETLKGMEREGIEVSLLSDSLIEEVFTLVDLGVVAKEAIPDILAWMVKHEGAKLDDVVEVLGLRMISEKELAALVERVVRENDALVKERKLGALGPLMGILMKELRGRVDARKVSQLIEKRIREIS